MKNAGMIFCGLAALWLTGCSQTDTRQEAQNLKDNEVRWNQEFAAKSVDKLAGHYADNAILMSPGMPPATGINAIRKLLTVMVDDPALSLQFQSARVEVAKSGDLAYTQGAYQMTMTDMDSKRIIHDHGSYVTTYSKQPDGSWKAVADIATSEAPSAQAPSATATNK
jgi:ketosteroid isomerase-like protein